MRRDDLYHGSIPARGWTGSWRRTLGRPEFLRRDEPAPAHARKRGQPLLLFRKLLRRHRSDLPRADAYRSSWWDTLGQGWSVCRSVARCTPDVGTTRRAPTGELPESQVHAADAGYSGACDQALAHRRTLLISR